MVNASKLSLAAAKEAFAARTSLSMRIVPAVRIEVAQFRLAGPHGFKSFAYILLISNDGGLAAMSEKRETVLAVHGSADGYWYIGAGRSIAEGPYRDPDQLLTVASDLLAAEPHWRIDVFDVEGNKIISYSSDELDAGDLNPLRKKGRWGALPNRPPH